MNLRDRMKSGAPNLMPTETESLPKPISNDTMQNSNPPLQDLMLQKQSETIQKQSQEIQELTSTIQDMQSQMDRVIQELENLKKLGRTSDIERIQSLSSENSTLRKKLQEKSETIVSLNARIGMLSSADLILKENERLKQSNSELQKKERDARNEATATVSAVKSEYQLKQAELQASIDAANARERQAKTQLDEESARIDALAESKFSRTKTSLKRKYEEIAEEQNDSYKHRMKMLEREYKTQTERLYGLTFGGILYSFLATIFTAINSPRFSDDILDVCKFIGGFFSALWENASLPASAAWSLNEKIPFAVIDVIIPGLLAVLGFLAIFLGVLALVGFGLYKAGKFYTDHFADSLSVLVALLSLATLVWFADYLSFITWNLIVVFIIIHAVYIIIRMMITSPERY